MWLNTGSSSVDVRKLTRDKRSQRSTVVRFVSETRPDNCPSWLIIVVLSRLVVSSQPVQLGITYIDYGDIAVVETLSTRLEGIINLVGGGKTSSSSSNDYDLVFARMGGGRGISRSKGRDGAYDSSWGHAELSTMYE